MDFHLSLKCVYTLGDLWISIPYRLAEIFLYPASSAKILLAFPYIDIICNLAQNFPCNFEVLRL